YGKPGILHGAFTYLLQRAGGQIDETESVAPGLDYAAVGPEHSYLKDSGRVDYVTVSDDQARDAFRLLSTAEGILPALESCHAVAYFRHMDGRGGPLVADAPGRGGEE